MAAQVVTKNTLIGEMLQMDMGIAAILMAAGMHCAFCIVIFIWPMYI